MVLHLTVAVEVEVVVWTGVRVMIDVIAAVVVIANLTVATSAVPD